MTLLQFILDEAQMDRPVAVVTQVDENGFVRKGAINSAGETFGDFEPLPISELLRVVAEALAGSSYALVLDRVGEYVCAQPIVIEIIRPKISLIVFGAGHVGQAVATMGAILGYDVLVVDDRAGFLSRDRLQDERIRTLESTFENSFSEIAFTSRTAAVIVTRGHQHDETCLRGVSESNAGYIGMIGSKRRVLSVFKRLLDDGVPKERLERVHAPIGLKIGARTPQEIGISILAEVIQHFNTTNRRSDQ